MIIIKFEKGQGLGNQLFNYISGFALAKKLNYKLGIIDHKYFKGKNFLELKKFQKTYLKQIDNSFYEESFYVEKDINSYIYDFDEQVLKLKKNTLINGVFQNEKYFSNIKIKDAINFKKFIYKKNANFFANIDFKNSCILNIRGGEFKYKRNLILPKSYWQNCISYFKKKKISKFYIVTDDPKYVKNLFPNIKILGSNIEECYYVLSKSINCAVSNSSFSYFPLASNQNTKTVIAPLFWGRFGNNCDLWVSLSNIYSKWKYMNINGKIVDKEFLRKNYLYNLKYLSSYKIRTNLNNLDQSFFKKKMPIQIKKFLRYMRHGLKDI
jgi:hypothetical protein